MLNDRLDFRLNSFQRTSWVSEKLKLCWQPCLEKLAFIIDRWMLSRELFEIFPLQLRTMPRPEYYLFKKSMQQDGLYVDMVSDLPKGIRLAFGLASVDLPVVVIGQRKDVVEFLNFPADHSTVAAISKIPINVLEFWTDFSKANLDDPTWAYFSFDGGNVVNKQIEHLNSVASPLWRRSGIYGTHFLPSSLGSKDGADVVDDMIDIARKKWEDQNLVDRWSEILSWPCEWSALHGIAEIKTPLFKVIYNTDATGEKYVLRLTSDTYPKDGLPGIQFPYRKPVKLHFTESSKTKRGNEHLESILNG